MRQAKIGYVSWNKGKKETRLEVIEKLRISHLGQKAWNKGLYHSEECKKKISISKTGQELSREHKNNISLSRIGHVVSEETRNRIRESSIGKKGTYGNLGKKHSLETKRKIALANSGENSPNWKGGISREPYGRGWNNILKESIRLRDNYKCQVCFVPQEELNDSLSVHHINEIKTDLSPSNLISLCRCCHKNVHLNKVQLRRIPKGDYMK